MRKVFSVLLLVFAIGILSGCSSPKRFAENHFEAALEFIFVDLDVSSDDVEIHEVEYFGSIIDFNLDELKSTGMVANVYVSYTVVVYYLNMTIEDEDFEVLYMYTLAEDEDGKTFSEQDFDFGSKAEFDAFVESSDTQLENDREQGEIDKYRSSTGSIRSGVANRTLNRVLD